MNLVRRNNRNFIEKNSQTKLDINSKPFIIKSKMHVQDTYYDESAQFMIFDPDSVTEAFSDLIFNSIDHKPLV